VSAGALIASCLANGMTPEFLVRMIHGDDVGEEALAPETFFAPNYREFVRRGIALPRLIAQALWYLTHRRARRPVLAALSRAARALPVGIYDTDPIRAYLARTFANPGRTDDFRELPTRLVVVAADLESGRPVRFGLPDHPDVPISRAVQASCALPGVYPPVPVAGRVCVDGVLLKTLHASVALDEGVDLLLCVNPIVPVDAAVGVERGVLEPGALLDRGLPAVLSQTFRTLVHSRLEVGMASYVERYPGADVVLFEPGRDAYDMFFANLFSLESRREVCALAYRETRADLRRRAAELEPIFARHGIRLRRELLDDETREVWTGMALQAHELRARRRVAEHCGRRGGRLERVTRRVP
jgi:predicted acylesterase/phospholipase RssA